MNSGKLRLGIDVGGTFTHGVLLDAETRLVKSVRVPTTHRAQMGVAAGVAACLKELLEGIPPESVAAVNHSTTQATNALLEGDLSPVAVHVFYRPGEGFLLRRQLGFRSFRLSPESRVPVEIALHLRSRIPSAPKLDRPTLVAETLVDSEGELEREVCRRWIAEADEPGRAVLLQPATEISRLLGVKSRVKTGILNCAMLPTMLATLDFTERALQSVAPGLPLMVLKSDGGVMPAEVVFRKPLSCLLSGPAAGAAAALHFAGVNLGLFLEVGGTSTDIAFIHQGRVGFRPASVGGHRLQVETLDLRTVALGGGSLIGRDRHGGVTLGPRSAHVAGLKYLSFVPESELAAGRLVVYQEGDAASTYYAWQLADGSRAGFTLTDFANLQGVIPQEDDAFCERDKLRAPFAALLERLELTEEALLRVVTARIAARVRPAVAEYTRSFKPERALMRLVGGGGGVYSALPFISRELKLPFDVVARYPQISAVGAALAASTVSVRIPSADGSSADIEHARELAIAELSVTGIPPERASFDYRYEASAGMLRVTATAERPFERAGQLSPDELLERARELLGVEADVSLDDVFANASFIAFAVERRSGWLGRRRYLLLLDRLGRSRLLMRGCQWQQIEGAERMREEVARIFTEKRAYRDAGEVGPMLWVAAPLRFHDLSTLTALEACESVLSAEDSVEGNYLIVWKLPEV